MARNVQIEKLFGPLTIANHMKCCVVELLAEGNAFHAAEHITKGTRVCEQGISHDIANSFLAHLRNG